MKISDNEKWRIRSIYSIGITAWVLAWINLAIIFGGPDLIYLKDLINWFYVVAFIIGLLPLMSNLFHWWTKQEYQNYITEVKIIEFVERNANYLILALTAICFLSQAITTTKQIALSMEFILFISLSFIFLIGFVLPLIWAQPSNNNSKELVFLRHFKTVFYTYALGCTCGAVISLIKMRSF